jgi:hypothetical protein
MTRKEAMGLAIRCARDSVPPLHLEILLDVAVHERSRPVDLERRLKKPWRTVLRELQALHMLGLLYCEEEERKKAVADDEGNTSRIWRYSIAADFDIATLQAMAGQHPETCERGCPRGDKARRGQQNLSPEKSDQGDMWDNLEDEFRPRRGARSPLGNGGAATSPDFSGDSEA